MYSMENNILHNVSDAHIEVDFSKIDGVIKPLHGIGNAPIIGSDDKLFHFLGDAGIPYSRLHDTGGRYGCGCYVDIANIFRDFDCDPECEESYDFAFTDWLLSLLVREGVKPFYRLGATIENSHRIKAYNIFPPKDNYKWARICAGIVRHYNEGWANGFYFGIEYFEIWNEPDNEPEIKDNPMWKGTKEQYFELYDVASKELKREFPYIKVGGYASCGFYAVTDVNYVMNANSSSRTECFITFFHEFLAFVKKNNCPFDFFSWHTYADIKSNVIHAKYARKTLDEYGFCDTESILNEWNPGICNRGKSRDAALISAMMCALQSAPVDKLMYYDGQVHGSYNGLFNPITFDVFKAYYAFVSWNALYTLGGFVKSGSSNDDVYVCAASDGKKGAVLIANTAEKEIPVNLLINGNIETEQSAYIVDETHTFEKIEADNITMLPPNSILLLK